MFTSPDNLDLFIYRTSRYSPPGWDFVVFLVDTTMIISSTLSVKATLSGARVMIQPRRRDPILIPDVTLAAGVGFYFT